jgi:hypothetical protein
MKTKVEKKQEQQQKLEQKEKRGQPLKHSEYTDALEAIVREVLSYCIVAEKPETPFEKMIVRAHKLVSKRGG